MSKEPDIEAYRKFIRQNLREDPVRLLLKYKGRQGAGFSYEEAVLQIGCRRKTAHKLAGFLRYEEFLFPDSISAEQCTCEAVAEFHATLITKGESVLDMTAGLGIDAMTIALTAGNVTAIETDCHKCECLRHNARSLGLDNLEVIDGDSMEWLRGSGRQFDTIYIDPARRKADKSRAYALIDCTPDITQEKDMLLEHCERILVKTSPMIDITQCIRELEHVGDVYAVCHKGECKEVLAVIRKNTTEPTVTAIDLSNDSQITMGMKDLNSYEGVEYTDISGIQTGGWLYEPNAAVMKAGCWSRIAKLYAGLKKLDRDTHLFYSDNHYPDFPGRALRITHMSTGADKKRFKGMRRNVVARNYPVGAENLKKKLGVRDGGSDFVYGARIGGKPMLLECSPADNVIPPQE